MLFNFKFTLLHCNAAPIEQIMFFSFQEEKSCTSLSRINTCYAWIVKKTNWSGGVCAKPIGDHCTKQQKIKIPMAYFYIDVLKVTVVQL